PPLAELASVRIWSTCRGLHNLPPPVRLTQPDEKVRLRERRACGVVRADEALLTEDRSERPGRQVGPERLLDLAGVGGERGALSFDKRTDVDSGCDARFDGVQDAELLR